MPGEHQMSSWRLPGRFWAPCGPKVAARRAPNGAWGRPGEPKQIVGWTPGPLRGAKLIDFRVPGGSPEASEGGSGVVFLDFVRSRGAGNQKTRKRIRKTKLFLLVECLFFIRFLVLFGLLVAAPARERSLRNH